MRRYMLGLVVAALAATAGTASAQDYRRTVVTNSGNGVNNTIAAGNRGFRVGFPGPVGYPGAVNPYGAPIGYPGFPAAGGSNKTIVRDSGNGIGNVIQAGNGGGGFYPGYPFGPGGFGVNVNVVTNSGNGINNTIQTGNGGGRGGININVITNSGNGAGNVIQTGNRR